MASSLSMQQQQQQQQSGLMYNPQIRQTLPPTSYNHALDPRTGSFDNLMDRKKKEKRCASD
jgi:hypothetical protein